MKRKQFWPRVNPPKRQILDSSKLREFADNNFIFDENGRKFTKRVENTVGKGEIARYEEFFLFPLCFQKDLYCRRENQGLFGKGLNISLLNRNDTFKSWEKHYIA